MEIRQLKAFLAIAESETFTADAKRVNITQAAISMHFSPIQKEFINLCKESFTERESKLSVGK